jgi:hypothetical protein
VGEGHPARDWFRDRYPRRRATVSAAIAAGIETGEIRPDVDSDSVEIIAMMDGLQVQWGRGPGSHGDDPRQAAVTRTTASGQRPDPLSGKSR